LDGEKTVLLAQEKTGRWQGGREKRFWGGLRDAYWEFRDWDITRDGS